MQPEENILRSLDLDGQGERKFEADEPKDIVDDATLFVGDLARGISEDVLQAKFNEFGEVLAVDIKRDKVTRNNLGYGFVQFKSRAEAAAAKKALDGSDIAGRKVRLGWASKNTNLFVGDLDGTVTSEQLRDIFSKFGPIYEEETFVKHNKYGFVRFKTRAHAESAKAEMDGKVIGSKAIRIGWGDTNTQRHCVHLQFDPAQAGEISEADVRAFFDSFGEITKVSLPKFPDKRLKGYAFIHFVETDAGEEAASKAIAKYNRSTLPIGAGLPVLCNYGKRQQGKARRGPPHQHQHQHHKRHHGGRRDRHSGHGQQGFQFPVVMGGQHGVWPQMQYHPNNNYYQQAAGGSGGSGRDVGMYIYQQGSQYQQPYYDQQAGGSYQYANGYSYAVGQISGDAGAGAAAAAGAGAAGGVRAEAVAPVAGVAMKPQPQFKANAVNVPKGPRGGK